MGKWITAKLGNYCSFQEGYVNPSQKNPKYFDGTIKWVRAVDLNNGYVYDTSRKLTDIGFNSAGKSALLFKPDTIVISKSGTIGRLGIIKDYMCGNRATINIIPNENADLTFIFHLLLANQQRIAEMAVGSVQKNLYVSILDNAEFLFPDLEEQRTIGEFLSSITKKIEVCRRINDNLLQQADLLFKSWFLDYAPWGGNIPESWISGKLGEYTEIKRGGSPRPIQEYLSDSGLRWLKISDVTSLSSPFVIDIKDHIIESGLRKTVLLSAGSLVLSNSATPGIPKILDVDSCIHDGWLYFPKSVFSKEFLYLYFRYIRQHLVNLSNGSVFNNLKTDILKEYPTTLPDSETLHQFDETVKPMFDRMQGCARESHMLAELRDALLPRLMSGEIDVSSITI